MDPALISIYSQADLAKYLSLHPSRVWRWLRSDARWLEDGSVENEFTFAHLIEMRVVAQMLELGISIHKIQRAYRQLRKEFGEFPLAQKKVPLMEFARTPVRTDTWQVAGGSGQFLLDELVKTIGREIHYAKDGLADEWHPVKGVLLNPSRQFGTPVVSKNIPTRILYKTYVAEGENAQRVAWWYDVTVEDVKAAVAFELSTTRKKAKAA